MASMTFFLHNFSTFPHHHTDGVFIAGIDLENIVYYRDNTHYFVMTAKKQSLLDKGVVLNVSQNVSESIRHRVNSLNCSFLLR